jgi:transglutaminase-like putative cysteine protease
VYSEIDERVSEGAVNAVDVLTSRRGNANDQTALLVAMARAIELPARPVSGLVYLNGRFYHHAWAEVFLDDWVPVDPTHGQFPADASHLRFVVGGFARQLELLRALGDLSLDVLEARTE